MSKEEAAWVRIQRKTFTRWCNNFLQQRNTITPIESLETDLADGLRLHALLEILSNEEIQPKPNQKAKMKLQKVENINTCLRFIKSKEIKLVGIGPEDIFDGKTSLILGLIWTLILRFQIETYEEESDEGRSAKQALLEWCNKVLNPQGIIVINFKDSWQDGRAFCGLVDALEPNAIPLEECPPTNAENNLNRAFDTAERLFQFPKVLDAPDVIDHPDELSIMTYVSYFRAFLAANTAHAPFCFAEGPGLTEATSGKPGLFKVFAVNEEGVTATRGGANVKATLTDASGAEVAKVKVRDNLNGSYDCQYVSPKPGAFTLNVMISKAHIKDSPFYPQIKPGEPKPNKCVASGDGISHAVAGQPAHFTIHSKDASGNDITEGGATVLASLSDASGAIPVDVVDNRDGTYSCTYVPRTAAKTKLEVAVKTEMYGTENIHGAPFTIDVNPGSASATFTEASGPGTKGAVAGETAPITVTTKDEFGNLLLDGGAPISATLTNLEDQSTLSVDVLDNNDGTYNLSYIPQTAGNYQLDVKLGEESIKDTPLVVSVAPGAADPLNFSWSEFETDKSGKRVLVAGVTEKFNVQAKDSFGNPLTNGGLKIKGKLTGEENVPVNVQDLGDGSYEVSYTPHKAGDYKLDVTVDGQPIGGGPNPVPLLVIAAAPSASNTVAEGQGIESAKVGGKNPFKVLVRDAFDNPVGMGGQDIGGQLVSDDGQTVVPVEVVDNGDGTYDCSYPSIKKAGNYSLTPTLNGEPIKGAPFSVSVDPGSTSTDNTLVEFPEHHIAGFPALNVTLRDDQCNKLKTGGDKVRAHLLPLTDLEVNAHDNGDGTYRVEYPPNLSGDVDVVIKVNGKVPPTGNFPVQVQDNPVKEETQAQVKELLPGSARVMNRLLTLANDQEREAILAELNRLSKGKRLPPQPDAPKDKKPAKPKAVAKAQAAAPQQ